MTTANRQIKVLLYGNVFRDYRSRILLKILLNCGYHVSLICPDFYFQESCFLLKFLYLIELMIKGYFVEVIYLPPMNHQFIKSACLIAKIFNKKLIVEMYVSIYDTFVGDRKLLKGTQIKPKTRKANSMLKKDVLALKKADFIIHTANHELNYWSKLLNTIIKSEKVFIAPNFTVSQLNHQRKFRQDGQLKICWWGTFIPLHGLENILGAIKILQSKQIEFSCSLFGVDNSLFLKYAQKIKSEGLEDCVFLRKDLNFANNSLPKYLINNCDLALGIFGNTDKANNTVPNKLIEALSMGIPTLTMNSSALKEFFDPKIDLWTCEPSPESIAESILIIANSTAYPVNWKRTRQKVLDTFSVTRYQEVICKVLEQATQDSQLKTTCQVEQAAY